MEDDEYTPCDSCGQDCDGWDMGACCTLCQWESGTTDPELLGCDTCTKHDDL